MQSQIRACTKTAPLLETTHAAERLYNADFAMYMARGSGKNWFRLFDADVHDSPCLGEIAQRTSAAQQGYHLRQRRFKAGM